MPDIRVVHGDCVVAMRAMDDACVDAIVTDAPYHLTNVVPDCKACVDCGRVPGGRDGKVSACPKCGGTLHNQRSAGQRGFMSKAWDGGDVAFRVETWAEALRVLKPGAHMLVFGGTRTYHRMACAIEDAGFEIRDCIRSLNGQDHYPAWVYGSGFPKSLDVSKAIDKAAGAEREVIGEGPFASRRPNADHSRQGLTFADDAYVRPAGHAVTAPATPEAQQWAGWGTALKPAWEPICVARKPLSEKTVAANVLKYGTGAINIDGCRVAADDGANQARPPRTPNAILGGGKGANLTASEHNAAGRWPANIITDGSDEVLEAFGESKSTKAGSFQREMTSRGYKGGGLGQRTAEAHDAVALEKPGYGDAGSPARFFMSCKTSAIEEVNGALVWLLWRYKVDIIVNNSNGVDKCPSTNAQHAEPHSPLSLLPTSNIAQSGATVSANSKIGQSANSAASLFGSCATPTVPNPARARIKSGSDLTERFTSATASELRRLSETLTTVIQSIESACSRGSQPTKLSLTLNHAECVATREPTGTTQITISHWRSSGCAEPVTFSITPKNSVPGVAGSPSRFIYSAKASRADRAGSKHPTVKPVALIEYLAKLVTPPGGTVLDPFAGSGTLAVAASRLGFNAILIEREAEYVAMIHGRLDALRSEAPLVAGL